MTPEVFGAVAEHVARIHKEEGPRAWTMESDSQTQVIRLRCGAQGVAVDCSTLPRSTDDRSPKAIAEEAHAKLLGLMRLES